ncbi:MAG: hypothetical protein P4L45_05530 [Ignavibacteriaceae bacterium]|nr:hypothetical protein [Ignavibacteriaceae bacterium]
MINTNGFYIIKSILLVFISAFIAFAQNKQEFNSPDKTIRVVVSNISDGSESKIHIYNSKGKILFDTSYISKDHQHGFKIIQTNWTANSKYFVFSLSNSGGHQPWHYPTFIYCVPDKKLLSVDSIWGAVTSDFKLTPPDSLETSIKKKDIRDVEKIKIKISDFVFGKK